jgi:hypothetical protein
MAGQGNPHLFDGNQGKIRFRQAVHHGSGCGPRPCGGKILGKVAAKKGWNVTGMEIYPTGTGDFSMGLIKVKKTESQVIIHLDGYARKRHSAEAVV